MFMLHLCCMLTKSFNPSVYAHTYICIYISRKHTRNTSISVCVMLIEAARQLYICMYLSMCMYTYIYIFIYPHIYMLYTHMSIPYTYIYIHIYMDYGYIDIHMGIHIPPMLHLCCMLPRYHSSRIHLLIVS